MKLEMLTAIFLARVCCAGEPLPADFERWWNTLQHELQERPRSFVGHISWLTEWPMQDGTYGEKSQSLVEDVWLAGNGWRYHYDNPNDPAQIRLQVASVNRRGGWKFGGAELSVFARSQMSIPGHDFSTIRTLNEQRIDEFLGGGIHLSRHFGIALKINLSEDGTRWKAIGHQEDRHLEVAGVFQPESGIGWVDHTTCWRQLEDGKKAGLFAYHASEWKPSWRPGLLIAGEFEYVEPDIDVRYRATLNTLKSMKESDVNDLLEAPSPGGMDRLLGPVVLHRIERYADDGKISVETFTNGTAPAARRNFENEALRIAGRIIFFCAVFFCAALVVRRWKAA